MIKAEEEMAESFQFNSGTCKAEPFKIDNNH